MSNPQRTCIGCRVKTAQKELIKLVCLPAQPGQLPRVVFDQQQQYPGRGAWLHEQGSCLEKARRKAAFNRAFRGRVDASRLTV
ncbi:MAG: YlxR family protein [Rothia sp. (in: high G+C Gram-positive bacteria)]|nr:YlxR family protein [Rothia sp. (in: high G+C Gram-positive bacteria)]